MNGTGRLVAAARWDDKALPAVVFHADAKTRQQFQGDVDVGLGDEFALDINGDGLFLCQQGQCHEQRGQKLAGNIAAHADGRSQMGGKVGVADFQRRVAWGAQVVNLAAQLAQGIDQIANRALVHARDAGHFKLTAQHRQGSRQGAHGGAGVA